MAERSEEFTEGTNHGLTDEHKAILDHEEKWGPRNTGPKQDSIMQNFKMLDFRYYQKVNALLDNPAALEYKPEVVNRLRRIRETTRRRWSPKGR